MRRNRDSWIKHFLIKGGQAAGDRVGVRVGVRVARPRPTLILARVFGGSPSSSHIGHPRPRINNVVAVHEVVFHKSHVQIRWDRGTKVYKLVTCYSTRTWDLVVDIRGGDCQASHSHHVQKRSGGNALVFWLRVQPVPAIRAAVRVAEPFLDAVVSKHVLASGQAKGGFDKALGSIDTVVIVANDTCCHLSVQISPKGIQVGAIGLDALLSLSGRSPMLTLRRDCNVVFDATILLDMAPRAAWICLTAASVEPEPEDLLRLDSLAAPSMGALDRPMSLSIVVGSDAVCREAANRRDRKDVGRLRSEDTSEADVKGSD